MAKKKMRQPTASKGQIHSAVNKEKIDKAAKAANERSKKANKYNPTKEEMVGSKTKRPANFGEIGKRQKKDKDIDKSIKTVAIKNGSSISKAMGEDKTKMPEEDMGPVMDSANRIAEMEAKAAKAMKKKKKVTKKMGGGYMKKKMAGGGPLKTVDVENNPGLAKLPTPVRNKMGFAKGGGKVYKYGHGGDLGKTKGKKVSGNDGNSIVAACYD